MFKIIKFLLLKHDFSKNSVPICQGYNTKGQWVMGQLVPPLPPVFRKFVNWWFLDIAWQNHNFINYRNFIQFESTNYLNYSRFELNNASQI